MRKSLLLAALITAVIAGVASATNELNSGLVAQWDFDGSAQDSSGNGNHGTVAGAKYAGGIRGQALLFDGMDNYFTATITESLKSIRSQGTILAWINFSDTYLIKEPGDSCSTGSRSLVLWRFGTYAIKSGAVIDCSGRMVSEWRNDGSQTGQGISQQMKSGKWHHVALVYNGENVILFIDGEKVSSNPLTGMLNNSDGKFWIGRNGYVFYPMFYHGLIDEVRLYNRALSQDEIQSYYYSLTGSTAADALEPKTNIYSTESISRDLLANQYVTYSFSPGEHGIYEIPVKSPENRNGIMMRVEGLKERSKFVTSQPPGIVYANMNIIISTQNIKDAIIRFKVENSWFQSNDVGYYDIKMVRWDGGKWTKLETNKKTLDEHYAYYEAKTYGFSSFAITGIKETSQAVSKPGTVSKSQQDNGWIILLILILLAVAGFRHFSKKKNVIFTNMLAPIVIPGPAQRKPEMDMAITSAFGYKGATILYKVRLENRISSPIADIKVFLFVPNVFLLLEKEKSIALLKPGESKTATFEIRPTGECGDCEVSGKVTYYDTGSNRTKEVDIDAKMLSIVCPMLKVKEISEVEWHSMVSNLLQTEENTKEIDMPAETLFAMTSRIIKDMHMHMLRPEVTDSQQLFNGVARFYGEGVKGLKYAAQAEVVGGARKSKLILRAWAEKEDALTGFYHGILDEIEKRINVKGYIDEPIVQHFNIAGHYVTGQVEKIIDVGDRSVQDNGRDV